MAMTKATAQTHLDAWEAADLAIATAGSYTINGRQLTRTNAQEVRNMITYWQRVVKRFTADTAGNTSPGVLKAQFK